MFREKAGISFTHYCVGDGGEFRDELGLGLLHKNIHRYMFMIWGQGVTNPHPHEVLNKILDKLFLFRLLPPKNKKISSDNSH
jgi:hypothetical protein